MGWTERDLVPIGCFAVRPELSTPAFGPKQYLVGGPCKWDMTKVHPAPIPASSVRLGYDVCGRCAQSKLECSPIVCNGYADGLRANRFCLLETFDQAIVAAERFIAECPAPGPYVVLEVWAERWPDAP